jgi:dihydrofolate synthase/folylpolyglutamate synthase
MSSQSFDPERWLGSLDPLGWRFGLDRIRALLAELGEPQGSFESIHVVGTNGKSSVAAMAAALIQATGRSAGCYLSPHRTRWAERILIQGNEISPVAFARAAKRVSKAVDAVEPGFSNDERVTQFEAATAVAFCAFAEAGVDAGVIEAGLGGRLDATNVLDSRATALTSVGLDHTAWLGETELEIAAEKLAVLKPGTTLVLGDVSPAVARLAAATAGELGCELVRATEGPAGAVAAPYQRRNLGVAIAAAATLAGPIGSREIAVALDGLRLPGRFEYLEGDPPLILDAAHNPDGARALAEALAAMAGERPVLACLAILADKDADGIVRALCPAISEAIVTAIPAERLIGVGRPRGGSVPAADLALLLRAQGVEATAAEDPAEAVRMAIERARERMGVALVAGSHYLLGYAWTERHAQSSSR